MKEQLKLNSYVDNVMGLVANEHQGKQFREETVKIMEKGKFPLTKWESNFKLLNDDDQKKSQPNFQECLGTKKRTLIVWIWQLRIQPLLRNEQC